MIKNVIDIYLDKLTNSIENSVTGEVFDTAIEQVPVAGKAIKQDEWIFDWEAELNHPKRKVYKLTTINNTKIIQGLICVEVKTDHVFVHLIESANFNKGSNKMYIGVAGNLFAYACKLAFENDFDGYVAFDSKSALIDHYKEKLGATHLQGQRMFIESVNALKLVKKYFKEEFNGNY